MDPAPVRTPARQALGLAGWLVLTFLAAAAGGVASGQSGAFYAALVRPAWAPPGWLFGPVWTVLYLLMGVAAWLVWRRAGGPTARLALGLYLLQLVANGLWTWLFFVWRQGAWALVDVLLLAALIVACIVLFRRISPLAAMLLWPYLAWVSFASALTLALWRLNPGVLG